MKLMKFFAHFSGMILIEALLAVALFLIFAPALLILSMGSLQGAADRSFQLQAALYAQEGIEAVRSIRDNDWTRLTDGPHGLTDAAGFWDFEDVSDVPREGFTRKIVVTSEDADTRLVTARVDAPGGAFFSFETAFTNWERSDWIQTTAEDFYAGTVSLTTVTQDFNGEVRLSPGAVSGTFVSSEFDSGSATTDYTSLLWTRSGVGTLRFQLRTADTREGLPGAVWVGPDGLSTSYYTASDTPIVPDAGSSGTRWIQTKAFFDSDGTTTPVLEDFTVRYNP